MKRQNSSSASGYQSLSSMRRPYVQRRSGTALWSLSGRKGASMVGDAAGEVQLRVPEPEHSNKNICMGRLLVQGVRTQEEGLH